jgi:hypothetical protein
MQDLLNLRHKMILERYNRISRGYATSCDSPVTAEGFNMRATMDPTDELVGLCMQPTCESATVRNSVFLSRSSVTGGVD